MNINIQNSNIETILLGDLVEQERIEVKRGKVIAKTTGQYPVYSSSVKNNGLMCYSDEYMFNEELISWSVDGGGDFFYRPKHKYSLTNVSGYIRVLDKNINCKYLYCILSLLHSKEHFDYTTKAHPSVICKMYKVPLPDIKTQEKIATILFEIDNKVIKLEQIIAKLKETKQSFLELLFPNNCNVPQLRFRDFTLPWEQRKLSEIATEIVAGGDVNKKLLMGKGQFPVIANALTHEGIVGYYENQFRIKAPAVTITGRGDVGHAQARIINFTPVVRLISLKTNHDVFFLENAINTLKIVIESTGVPQLTVPQIGKYKISIPSNKMEEICIGKLFSSLDRAITLHQRKLDKLKEVKSALLDKLLV